MPHLLSINLFCWTIYVNQEMIYPWTRVVVVLVLLFYLRFSYVQIIQIETHTQESKIQKKNLKKCNNKNIIKKCRGNQVVYFMHECYFVVFIAVYRYHHVEPFVYVIHQNSKKKNYIRVLPIRFVSFPKTKQKKRNDRKKYKTIQSHMGNWMQFTQKFLLIQKWLIVNKNRKIINRKRNKTATYTHSMYDVVCFARMTQTRKTKSRAEKGKQLKNWMTVINQRQTPVIFFTYMTNHIRMLLLR